MSLEIAPSIGGGRSAPISGQLVVPLAGLLRSSNGRDKLTRLFQYLARMLRGALPPSHPLHAVFANVETSLTAARQVARLLKFVPIMAASRRPTPDDGLFHDFVAMITDVFLALFFALDNISFLFRMKARTKEAAYWKNKAAVCWTVSSLAGFVAAAARRKHQSTVRYAADAVIAAGLARKSAGLPEWTPLGLGSCGVVSSLIQVYGLWGN